MFKSKLTATNTYFLGELAFSLVIFFSFNEVLLTTEIERYLKYTSWRLIHVYTRKVSLHLVK